MPIGPVFSGVAESAHFLLETVGEDVMRALPRLFYKYRGIEKIAEGRSIADVLLLAERFAATTAFAHALGFCQAVETVAGAEVPARARLLRVFLAELERVRHHVGAVEGICESTALVVAASQMRHAGGGPLRMSGHTCRASLPLRGGDPRRAHARPRGWRVSRRAASVPGGASEAGRSGANAPGVEQFFGPTRGSRLHPGT